MVIKTWRKGLRPSRSQHCVNVVTIVDEGTCSSFGGEVNKDMYPVLICRDLQLVNLSEEKQLDGLDNSEVAEKDVPEKGCEAPENGGLPLFHLLGLWVADDELTIHQAHVALEFTIWCEGKEGGLPSAGWNTTD